MSAEDHIEVAPNFEKRLDTQRQFEQKMLSEGEYDWAYPFGAYQNWVYSIVPYYEQHKRVEILRDRISNFEVYLYGLIEGYLSTKPTDTPIVLLDIGGGVGSSWSRLALIFEKEVTKNRLSFVVSNLVHTPEEHLDRTCWTTDTADSLLSRSRHLMHFIKGPYRELKDRTIQLRDGRKMPLLGNVDIAHEKLSLTAWSTVPEVDILTVPPLLSDYGMYFVCEYDTYALEETSSDEDEANRLQGIEIAHRLLETHFGLRKVTKVESGKKADRELGYVVFKSAKAPLVTVD